VEFTHAVSDANTVVQEIGVQTFWGIIFPSLKALKRKQCRVRLIILCSHPDGTGFTAIIPVRKLILKLQGEFDNFPPSGILIALSGRTAITRLTVS
jgi:hypothetical protein